VILCDTGPLVAAFNTADRDHGRCTEFKSISYCVPSSPKMIVPSAWLPSM